MGTKCFQKDVFATLGKSLTQIFIYYMHNSVLMTNEMHNSYNQFYSTIFRPLYMFRTNLVVHHQEHGIIYCITQFGTFVGDSPDSMIVPIVLCNTVYYAVLLMMND